MEYNDKLRELKRLKRYKDNEYKTALSQYDMKDQMVISFEEVARLKDELEEISNLIIALKRAFNKI